MSRQQEKVLVAALAGVVIACAAVFAIQPAMADNGAKPLVWRSTNLVGPVSNG